ncbi:MAG: single-stranded DNA-binding protein [Opitutaceae bacterium]|nr:single-stranded DNA-binding protein [Opitutaceae bacterium]
MASFNQVILVGNLTRDPEIRVTPKGTSICAFGLAVNRTWRDESGQDREEVTFVDVEAWGKQAEIIHKYLTKGSQALVQGRLKLDQWEDKQSGQKRSKLKVVLENVQFLGSPQGGGGQNQSGDQEAPFGGGEQHGWQDPSRDRNGPAPRAPGRFNPSPRENVDDDIPF